MAKINEPTEYRTDVNVHALNCGVCGQIMYVDEDTHGQFENAAECDRDNQFVCGKCDQDYEDEAYE
jgi:DNA replicative helicase MCM subunit Mcm2 (Cdc46/Mcm family)